MADLCATPDFTTECTPDPGFGSNQKQTRFPMSVEIFERRESSVRSYCRSFPAVFSQAEGSCLWDEEGNRYLDFLSGAGSLNYGHAHPRIIGRVIEYLQRHGVVQSLDLHTTAKRSFLQKFEEVVLVPRRLDYRIQFAGPTGTNAVEAAVKLARKVTGRVNLIAFTNAFHGMSLGALSATGSRFKRAGAGVPLNYVTRLPFDRYLDSSFDSAELLDRLLDDPGAGIDPPCAILLETVQAEGGLHVARPEWLRRVAQIAKAHGALLIIDEIQTGCGRTGPFFSFERANLAPDIVCVSKSISGLGLPMAIVLIRPEIDRWEAGQHNGTFRGNNLGFVGAEAALSLWQDPRFVAAAESAAGRLRDGLDRVARQCMAEVRGEGLLLGLAWKSPAVAPAVSAAAYRRGLIVETCGARSEVLKLLPPLTVATAELQEGLDILMASAIEAIAKQDGRGADAPLSAVS
jgi:diaminobutyrate-2-oxoglutarate transaminase